MNAEVLAQVKQLILGLAVVVGASFVGYTYVRQPPAAPSPTTPTGNLAALVPAESRPRLSAFYATWSEGVDYLKTSGQFRAAYRISVPMLQSQGKLPEGLGEFDAEISRRFEATFSLDDKPLDDETRTRLKFFLNAISEELKQ